MSRRLVIRLIQAQKRKARPRKHLKCTANSEHDQPVAANLLDRKFEAEQPNHKSAGDTTELATANGKLFLAVILHLFSKYVAGWSFSPVNDRHLTLAALKRAIVQRCPGADLLHHSTRVAPTPARTSRRSSRSTASPTA